MYRTSSHTSDKTLTANSPGLVAESEAGLSQRTDDSSFNGKPIVIILKMIVERKRDVAVNTNASLNCLNSNRILQAVW
jgi:hypothetical protein